MLRDIIRELNGQPIITSRTGMTFSKLWYENKSDERLPFIVSGEAPEPEVQGMFRGILPKEMLYDIIASDASDFQEHAFSVLRIEDAHIRKLSEKERGFSSGQRELGAMLNYLRGKANDIYSDIPKIDILADRFAECVQLVRERITKVPYSIRTDIINEVINQLKS